MSRCIHMLLLLALAVLLPAASGVEVINTRKPLPTLDYVWAQTPGDGVDLTLYSDVLQVMWYNETNQLDVAVSWKAPLWRDSSQKRKGASSPITAPVLVIGTPTFRISMTNNLPFQPPCSCNYDKCNHTKLQEEGNPTGNPLGVVNGVHNLHYTNVHTHGLKVDVGKQDVSPLDPVKRDTCTAFYNVTALCGADGALEPRRKVCNIFSDDIFAGVVPGGMKSVNTYFLPNTLPGLHWYHHHTHGSVAYLNPTSKGLLLVPDINPWQMFAPVGSGPFIDRLGVRDWRDWTDAEFKYGSRGDRWRQNQDWSRTNRDWIDSSLWRDSDDKNWTSAGANLTAINNCRAFIQILKEMPNFSDNTQIIESGGIWMRLNNTNQADDDSLAFIAKTATPPSSLLFNVDGSPIPGALNNSAGRDFYPWNGVIQPTISLEAGRWKRWLLIGTHTMKWKDITIRKLASGSKKLRGAPLATECEMWLLGWDGVYFENLPRKPMSSYKGEDGPDKNLTQPVNNIVLGPATRADILVRCNKEGTFVVASGAGPFVKNPGCQDAVHCELIGYPITTSSTTDKNATGNNFFNGTELDAAVLAVLEVAAPKGCQRWWAACVSEKGEVQPSCGVQRPSNCAGPAPALTENMCRTRLELYHYLNYNNFPNATTQQLQQQCFDITNLNDGAGCRINDVELGNKTEGFGYACLNQTSTQVWDYRGLIYHPFHLHESPVRTEALPACLNSSTTNNTTLYQVGDWHDTVFIPMCQLDPEDPVAEARGSQQTRKFLATPFPAVPQNFATNNPFILASISNNFLKQYECLQQQTVGPVRQYCKDPLGNNKVIPCADRWSVLHCHHLPHEDEGCIILTYWSCGKACTRNGQCPNP